MTAPKWTRPQPPPTIWHTARQAINDAQHAGDPALAARILTEAAWACLRYERVMTDVRPPLGVRRGAVRDEAA